MRRDGGSAGPAAPAAAAGVGAALRERGRAAGKRPRPAARGGGAGSAAGASGHRDPGERARMPGTGETALPQRSALCPGKPRCPIPGPAIPCGLAEKRGAGLE